MIVSQIAGNEHNRLTIYIIEKAPVAEPEAHRTGALRDILKPAHIVLALPVM